MPQSVVQIPADRYDVRTAAQIVPQPNRSLHQLNLEEVKRATVVRVHQQPVRLLRLELKLHAAVQTAEPFPELRKRILRTVQHERIGTDRTAAGAPERAQAEQQHGGHGDAAKRGRPIRVRRGGTTGAVVALSLLHGMLLQLYRSAAGVRGFDGMHC